MLNNFFTNKRRLLVILCIILLIVIILVVFYQYNKKLSKNTLEHYDDISGVTYITESTNDDAPSDSSDSPSFLGTSNLKEYGVAWPDINYINSKLNYFTINEYGKRTDDIVRISKDNIVIDYDKNNDITTTSFRIYPDLNNNDLYLNITLKVENKNRTLIIKDKDNKKITTMY